MTGPFHKRDNESKSNNIVSTKHSFELKLFLDLKSTWFQWGGGHGKGSIMNYF